ncbi:MAG: PDZ domain-containing protein [Pseudomonadota bacterium]
MRAWIIAIVGALAAVVGIVAGTLDLRDRFFGEAPPAAGLNNTQFDEFILLEPEEFDIYANKTKDDLFIFHGKFLEYEEMNALEYDYISKELRVIFKNGDVGILDLRVSCAVEPYIQEAAAVKIVRTENREPVDGTTLPVEQVYPRSKIRKPARDRQGYFGATVRDFQIGDPKDFAQNLGFPGAVIVELTKGGPAALHGFQAGDRIIKFDDRILKDRKEFVECIKHSPPEVEFGFFVIRGNEKKLIKAKLGSVK